MRKHRDMEGRAESAGPLWDVVPTRPAAEARRDTGMARVEGGAEHADPGWADDAVLQVAEFARSHRYFATEDVRARYGTPEAINPKAWGPVMKRAEKSGIVAADGFMAVNSSNRSPKVRWRSCLDVGS